MLIRLGAIDKIGGSTEFHYVFAPPCRGPEGVDPETLHFVPVVASNLFRLRQQSPELQFLNKSKKLAAFKSRNSECRPRHKHLSIKFVSPRGS